MSEKKTRARQIARECVCPTWIKVRKNTRYKTGRRARSGKTDICFFSVGKTAYNDATDGNNTTIVFLMTIKHRYANEHDVYIMYVYIYIYTYMCTRASTITRSHHIRIVIARAQRKRLSSLPRPHARDLVTNFLDSFPRRFLFFSTQILSVADVRTPPDPANGR